MGKKIKNRSELLSHGHRHSRQTVLDITDAALEELDAYGRIRSFLKCEGNLLRIGDRCWDLDRKRNVYLIGAGKACNAMAMAVEDALGERLTDGIALVKILEPGTGLCVPGFGLADIRFPTRPATRPAWRFWTSLTGLDRRIYSCA